MGTKTENLDQLLRELEQLTEEIEVKLKLASMDARDVWREKLEPRLFEARQHVKEAKEHSRHALESTMKAFDEFARSLA